MAQRSRHSRKQVPSGVHAPICHVLKESRRRDGQRATVKASISHLYDDGMKYRKHGYVIRRRQAPPSVGIAFQRYMNT